MFGLRKLPGRYAGIVMPLLLSIFMSGIVSFVSTLQAWADPWFAAHLAGAWGWSWMIAFRPAAVLPLVRRLTRVLVERA
ncbi:MAG: hypothetical protein IPK65_07990 [Gammaproteobacteria bacterium]|nr:hypothetical protein [Gammaproteobacteria bacterium]